MKNQTKLSSLISVLLIASGVLLFVILFVPMWRIDLDAPQYPEGLRLLIYADKLGGNVDIINGLNHYIGMKTLHEDDFVEFKILPFIISFFGLFFITAGITKSRKYYSLCSLCSLRSESLLWQISGNGNTITVTI
jgi:copper chaperone NosL